MLDGRTPAQDKAHTMPFGFQAWTYMSVLCQWKKGKQSRKRDRNGQGKIAVGGILGRKIRLATVKQCKTF